MAQVTVYVPDKLWREYKRIRDEIQSSEDDQEDSTSRLFQMVISDWMEEMKPIVERRRATTHTQERER